MTEHARKFYTNTLAGYTVDTSMDAKPHFTHVYWKMGVDETSSMFLTTISYILSNPIKFWYFKKLMVLTESFREASLKKMMEHKSCEKSKYAESSTIKM